MTFDFFESSDRFLQCVYLGIFGIRRVKIVFCICIFCPPMPIINRINLPLRLSNIDGFLSIKAYTRNCLVCFLLEYIVYLSFCCFILYLYYAFCILHSCTIWTEFDKKSKNFLKDHALHLILDKTFAPQVLVSRDTTPDEGLEGGGDSGEKLPLKTASRNGESGVGNACL